MTRTLKSTTRDAETGEETVKTYAKAYNANEKIDKPDYLQFRHARKPVKSAIAPGTLWQTRCGHIVMIKKVDRGNFLAVSGHVLDNKLVRTEQFWTIEGHYSITVTSAIFRTIMGQHQFDLVAPVSHIASMALLDLFKAKEDISEKTLTLSNDGLIEKYTY